MSGRQSGSVLIEAVIAIVVVGIAASAAMGAWSSAAGHSWDAAEQAQGSALVGAALAQASALAFPQCSASAEGSACALPDGWMPPEIAADGWSAEARAKLAAPTPAEAAGTTVLGEVVYLEARAVSPRGTEWKAGRLLVAPASQ